MKTAGMVSVDRRQLLELMGVGGGVLAFAGAPAFKAFAQTREDTLVIALDTSDTTELDPVRDLHLTPPMTVSACYETLLTMEPGDPSTLVPLLATSWERTPEGNGWRFHLRDGVTFVSGNPMTAEDVKFSLDRVRFIRYQASQYVTNVEEVRVVDDLTVDVILMDPDQPILTILAAPSFAVTDRLVVMEHGGDASPEAHENDAATEWLNQNSAGTGPYRLVGWERNVGIRMVANPDYWGGEPAFERVVIRHFEDGAAQLLALQRGDVDAAFNLLPEQIQGLDDEPGVWLARETSADFLYMFLTDNEGFNKALGDKRCRQAVAHAIDYDGIIDGLLGGAAVRPVTFIPVGLPGSSEELTREIGFREDLEKSKELLEEAGYPDGFEFEFSYGTAMFAGTSYNVVAQKLQSDLARVGIKMNVNPMPVVNFRPLYNGGELTAGMTHWNPPAVENALWAWATVQRVAKRVHWTPPDDLVELVDRAAAASDPEEQKELYRQYQEAMVDHAHLIVLLQPVYRVGVREEIGTFPLTASGWMLNIGDVEPA